ncbi:methyl-CpG-binding domain-containing protein 4-like [Iris pallida]|uniref:Methyl-CpG-binding domain-containing protein 4-like n=2 Tax=Iris pallida TaxID=29817 RepID=A0AAX6DYX1_IRIPA|nr:methyl-CpG-binding domain-containing protein 4-like [Iris pallida]
MEKSRTSKETVGAYAVQCGRCSKWRLIPSREEYETIRESFIEDPWFCDKNPEVSCDDPGDIEYDTSRLWVIDKPNAPKTPPNTTRSLSLRKNLSRTDVTYVMPNGKRVRSTVEVEKFLETYPEYKDQFSVSNFSFATPKILEDMVPGNSAGSNKKRRTETEK